MNNDPALRRRKTGALGSLLKTLAERARRYRAVNSQTPNPLSRSANRGWLLKLPYYTYAYKPAVPMLQQAQPSILSENLDVSAAG
jgi:hypothetical protein